jgi:hypothetical protein
LFVDSLYGLQTGKNVSHTPHQNESSEHHEQGQQGWAYLGEFPVSPRQVFRSDQTVIFPMTTAANTSRVVTLALGSAAPVRQPDEVTLFMRLVSSVEGTNV